MGNLLSSRLAGIASLQPAYEQPLTERQLFSALARVFRWREQLLSISGEEHVAFGYQRILAAELGTALETQSTWHRRMPPQACSDNGRCSDQRDFVLHLERAYLSGSVREGTEVHVHEILEVSDLSLDEELFSRDQRKEQSYTDQSSDIDLMFELAPVSVYSEADPPPPSAPTGMVVVMEPADNPGYVLLRHHHDPACGEREQRLLSGYLVRKKMELFGKALLKAADRLGMRITDFDVGGGPACCIAVDDANNSRIDLVPCVSCQRWPSDAYRDRQRPSGRPSARLVARLCSKPAYLVIAGSQRLDKDAWRLSFSRQETILLRSLSIQQRICLVLLKHCNVILGHRFSSYHLKTSLLWVCEQRAPELWTWENMQDSMLAVVDFLLDHVTSSNLPCYFSPEINLLGGHGMGVHRPDVQNLKHGMPVAVRFMLACLLNSSEGRLFRRLLGHQMTGQKFFERYWKPGLREGLNGFSSLSTSDSPAIDAKLWSDNFLRPFQWERLPSSCRQPSWFAEHGLDGDHSETEYHPEDGW